MLFFAPKLFNGPMSIVKTKYVPPAKLPSWEFLNVGMYAYRFNAVHDCRAKLLLCQKHVKKKMRSASIQWEHQRKRWWWGVKASNSAFLNQQGLGIMKQQILEKSSALGPQENENWSCFTTSLRWEVKCIWISEDNEQKKFYNLVIG